MSRLLDSPSSHLELCVCLRHSLEFILGLLLGALSYLDLLVKGSHLGQEVRTGYSHRNRIHYTYTVTQPKGSRAIRRLGA